MQRRLLSRWVPEKLKEASPSRGAPSFLVKPVRTSVRAIAANLSIGQGMILSGVFWVDKEHIGACKNLTTWYICGAYQLYIFGTSIDPTLIQQVE
jgi:uncharacterized RDD family membrane protein YckC